MPDLIFAQGQTALLTAQFVTSDSGSPIDVPDATVTIVGLDSSNNAYDVVPPTPMLPLVTGFYYYPYPVPNTLSVANYTVLYSGTILGVSSVITSSMQIVPAGTPQSLTLTPKTVDLIAALSTYLRCALFIPVYHLLGRGDPTRTIFTFTFPRWNLTNPAIYLNDEETSAGTINYTNGTVTFPAPLLKTDRVHATFNFSFFSQIDMLRFLSDALSQINLEPPASDLTLEQIPDRWVGTLMMGAAKNAIMKMLMCLAFQQPQKIFGDPEAAQRAIADLQSLKQNYEQQFQADKATLKTKGPYPKVAVISTPEYTLPGGRSRWFRYLFSSNVG